MMSPRWRSISGASGSQLKTSPAATHMLTTPASPPNCFSMSQLTAARFAESRTVKQRTVVAVVEFPVRDVPAAARAFEVWRIFRPYFAGMTVAELMKLAVVFVKNAVIRVNQTKEFVASKEGITALAAEVRIISGQPGAAVGVVIHGDHVLIGNRRREHLHFDRQLASFPIRLKRCPAMVRTRLCLARDPDVHPESLNGLVRNAIVRFGNLRMIRLFQWNERIG